jgi:PAS domain S-box-containing protein
MMPLEENSILNRLNTNHKNGSQNQKFGSSSWHNKHVYPNKYCDMENAVDTCINASIVEPDKDKHNDCLLEREACYLSILDNIEDSVFSIDQDLRILTANKVFRERTFVITGMDVLPGTLLDDVVGRNQHVIDEWANLLKKALTGKTFKIETKFEAGGKVFYREASFTPIRLGDSIIGATCYSKDITNIKLQQEAFREKEELFRKLLENSRDGIVMVGVHGGLKYISPSVKRILGYSQEEVPEFWEMIHPDDRPRLKSLTDELEPRCGESAKVTCRVLTKQKTVRWIHCIFTNMLHEPSIMAFVGNYEDITERHELEVALEDVVHDLMDADERQTSIINSLGAKIALLNHEGIIVEVNEAWKQFAIHNRFNSKNYGLGDNYIEVCEKAGRNGDKTACEVAKAIREVLAGSLPQFTIEYACHSPEEKRWFNLTVYPLYRSYSSGVVVHHYDITERVLADIDLAFNRRNRDALINSTKDLMWSIDKQMRLITANHAFISSVKNNTGTLLAPGDKIIRPENSSEEETSYWVDRYNRVLSGEQFTEVIHGEQPKEYWLDISFNPILENEKVIGAACYSRDVTDQKMADQRLRQNQAMMAEAECIAHIGCWELDLVDRQNINANPLRWSDEVSRIFGYQPGEYEVTNENFFKAVHPEDREPIRQAMSNALEKNANYSIQHRIIRPDGEIRWVQEEAKLFLSEKTGEALKLVGTVLDITDRKYAEESLRLINERYELVTKATNDAIWDWNIQTGEIYWSEGYEILFGHSKANQRISIEASTQHIHPEDVQRVWASVMAEVINPTSHFWQSEYRYFKSDGSIAYVYDRGYIVCDEAGKAVRMVGAMQDITAQKLAEESLHKSEANLRTVFDHADRAYILLNKEFEILSYNSVASEWAKLAYNAEFKEGVSLISLMDADKQAEARSTLEKVLAGAIFQHEVCFPIPSGTERWFTVRRYPVRNKDGQILGVCIATKDCTRRKNFEIERDRLTNELLQRNKDLEQYAYIVSHNLRAPVANIIGFVDALLNMDLDENEKQDMMHGLDVSIKRLDSVIVDLNGILQVKNTISLQKETVNFSSIVHDILLSISHEVEKTQVIVHTNFEQVEEMLSQKSFLYSIFYNLITNSIKYRKPCVAPVIEVKSHKTENKIALLFTDNGLGIDLEKNQEQVFGLYKRFHPSLADGKGMGLFMVKTQVENLGGKISVESKVNIGTTFTISFEDT